MWTRTVTIVAGLVLAAGCKDKGGGGAGGKDKGGGDTKAVAAGPVAVAQVAAEDATMIPTGKPPEMIVIADADGTLRINAAPDSWAKLSTADLLRGAQQVDARTAAYAINMARSLGADG